MSKLELTEEYISGEGMLRPQVACLSLEPEGAQAWMKVRFGDCFLRSRVVFSGDFYGLSCIRQEISIFII